MIKHALLNQFFDALPRPRLSCSGRATPTYYACGIAGFYLAVLAALGGGLLAGRSLLVIALLALVCGLSFYVYAYLRMWIVGREVIVLLEHVWFTFACLALTLWALGEPVLAYLDVVSAALCFFLGSGRVGCTLVGCCHGHPSSVGITYTEECARDGFPRHLVGVRLFPVPAIEAAGLFAIGVIGLIALPVAQPGRVFVWFLLAYSVMRFGLEGIRSDRRPHFLGLSQARWMAIIEVGLALRLTAGEHRVPTLVVYTALLGTLVAALTYRWRHDWRRPLLNADHLRELRELVNSEIEGGALYQIVPVQRVTSQQVAVVISTAGAILPRAAHLSLALPNERSGLPLMCELAARAFPGLISEAGQLTSGRVLHLLVPLPLAEGTEVGLAEKGLAQALYGTVVCRLQRGEEPLAPPTPVSQVVLPTVPITAPAIPTPEVSEPNAAGNAPRWVFAGNGKDKR